MKTGGARGPRTAPADDARRNIAIIAHVDHGKTTLIDSMLRETGAAPAHRAVAERALDSGDLERERGITILAKCTSVTWRGARVNIVDTPGHADFGGEVERILDMVDGALLLVDAVEGPMPQTRFVAAKALARGLAPIVVVNKADRAEARPHAALDAVFDLFAALDANEAQLDFPALFASGREGWAVRDLDSPRAGLAPLFETIAAAVPPPAGDPAAPFAMLVSLLESDAHLGRVLTGRVHAGALRANRPVKAIDLAGRAVESGRATRLMSFRGLERAPVARAAAGDLIAVAGFARATVADTLCDPAVETPLPALPIDPPTVAVTLSVNDSPLAGRDGGKLTARQLGARLDREAAGNVAISVARAADDAFEVAGRGELQLGVLVETLRREGYEMSVGRPRVLFRDEDGRRLEPVEDVTVDVDEAYAGAVVEGLSARRGAVVDMREAGGGDRAKTRLVFRAPSRGLIGYHGQFLADTRGTGALGRAFAGWEAWKGPIVERAAGALVATAAGRASAWALAQLEERGTIFVEPGDPVYAGMIVGEHNRDNDLDVNPLRTKQLTNFRAAGKDDAVRLSPPRRFGVERAIAWIADDERVEVTPRAIRLRKRDLDPHIRKRAARRAGAA